MADKKSVAWRCQECNAIVECVHVSSALKTHFLETGHAKFRQMEETGPVLVLKQNGEKVTCAIDTEVGDARTA